MIDGHHAELWTFHVPSYFWPPESERIRPRVSKISMKILSAYMVVSKKKVEKRKTRCHFA